MKTSISKGAFTLVIAILFWRIGFVKAHASFQNLGFESASVPALDPDQFTNLPFSQVFPGWMGYLATNQDSQAVYNTISTGDAQISLIGHNSELVSNDVIAGNYTAVLQAGNPGVQVSAAIAQSALIPVGVMSLQFGASGDVENLEVTFNGQNIQFLALVSFSNYELYGGDISTFAGTTAELRFTEVPTVEDPFASVCLDLISFSDTPVPEPGTCALVLCGAVLCGINRWRKRT